MSSQSNQGFHDGERFVQELAGVRRDAARLEGMLAPAHLSAALAAFLAERTFAAITARDEGGALWTSPLVGRPGFLDVVDPTTLRIHLAPPAADPLHLLPAGQPVGLIAIDYRRRRRFRVNGTLTASTAGRLELTVDEAFGNCPRFIPQRTIDVEDARSEPRDPHRPPTGAGPALTDADRRTIRSSDSVLLGTTHPVRGNDTSHRGGSPGFVRLDHGGLWWPDYPGNNLFNSLGNLHADPEASLLLPDFATRSALHLTGTAELVLVDATTAGDEGGSGRRVVFRPRRRIRTPLPVASHLLAEPPHDPPLTDL